MNGIQNTQDAGSASFGDVLRVLRGKRGLTLADLAERTHYSRGHLNNVERGVKTPTTELADACDTALASGQTLQALVPERRTPAPPATVRPAQLPAASPRFVGRTQQLDALDAALPTVEGHNVVAIVHGAPGVGKTALALNWAHRVAPTFPDGQLFVDLRGFAPTHVPVDPTDVLEQFLMALGWPPDQMPTGTDERARLFRSVIHERRMLLLLDNAASSQQVRPLLPAGQGNATLITSRARLEGLVVREGAAELPLAPFEPPEALALLREVVGRERVEAQPAMALDVARRCGHLPLAVCLAAERVAAHPRFTLDILATDLAEEHARLDTLSTAEDQDTAIRGVFSWSYHNLSAANARVFRLIGLHPGPDVSLPVAAALTNLPLAEARTRLETLANGHLIEQTHADRFRLHDLIHAYAAELVLTDEANTERQAAVLRALTWYVDTTEAASRALVPRSHPLPAPRPETGGAVPFATYQDAMRWCALELTNLAAAVDQAVSHGSPKLAWRLAAALFEFFHVRKPWRVWEKTYRTGLAAARACGNRHGEASMLQGLALIDVGHQRWPAAQQCLEQALAIRVDLADLAGQAWSRTGLGQVLTAQQQYAQAVVSLEHALTLHREVGDQQGEAVSLIFLADAWRRQADHDNAGECAHRALLLFQTIGDRHGEGLALHQLSDTCLATGRITEALTHLREAVRVRREAGDQQGQADTLRLMAAALARAGQWTEASGCLRQALDIFEARADPAAADVKESLERLLRSAPDIDPVSTEDARSRAVEEGRRS